MGIPTRMNGRVDRRKFLRGGAVAGAGVALSGSASLVANADPGYSAPLPTPKPIPGGLDLTGFGLGPPYDFIHTFAPGPPDVVLPFTGGTLQGLDVEPSTITNRQGATALAFHVGTARGSDGRTYNLETDMRVMQGTYRTGGTTHRGTFAFI
jgi:hypothetical protein